MSELTKRTDDDDELPGCLALAQGIAEQRWPHTMDAQLWAVKWKEAIAANPAIPNDEGTMIGWFANAIMAGYDTAQMRSLRQPEREGWQPISTAPKDGTCILVSNEYGSWIAKYVPEYQSGYRPAVPWMSMMLNHDHMRWGVRALAPTNWQPLPALRVAAGEPPKEVIDVSLAIRALGKALELASEAPLHAEDDEWRAEYEHLSGIWRAWVIEFRSGEPPKEPPPGACE